MTPSELAAAYEAANPGGHFFSRNNMKFGGDTFTNYRVAKEPVTFRTWSGDVVTCWELQRKRPTRTGLSSSAYFCVETFRNVVKPGDAAGAEAAHIWRNWTNGQKCNYCQWTFGARLTLPELAALGVDLSAKVDAYLLDQSRKERAKHRAAGAA